MSNDLPKLFRRRVALCAMATLTFMVTVAPAQAWFDLGVPTRPANVIAWDLPGEAPDSSIAYSTEDATCDGDAPCLRLHDPTNDHAGTPCRDVDSGPAYLGICPAKNVDGLTVTGYALGVRVERPATIPRCGPTITLRQLAGATDTQIENGCAERVECTIAYVGTIFADPQDHIADNCKWLVVEGRTLRTAADPPAPATPETNARCGGSCGIRTQAATGGTAPDAVVPKPSGVPTDAGFLRQRRATVQSVATRRTTTGALTIEATVEPGIEVTVVLQRRTSRGLVQVSRLVRTPRSGHLSLRVRQPIAAPVERVVVEAGEARVADTVDRSSVR
jgi:hypothetical protein